MAKENIKAAKLLHEGQLYRIVVSRAYYAIFYVTSALLLEHGLTFSRHASIISAFAEHFVKTGRVERELQKYLSQGQAYREGADYDTGAVVTPEQSLEQIRRAEIFLSVGEKLLNPDTKE